MLRADRANTQDAWLQLHLINLDFQHGGNRPEKREEQLQWWVLTYSLERFYT